MAVKTTWELAGAAELLANLAELSKVPRNRAGRAAVRAAAAVVAKKLKANAMAVDNPDTPNKIPANVSLSFDNRLYRRTGDMAFRVGFLGGAKFKKINPGKKGPGGDTWYWRLVEFGTKDVRARPFVRPALGESTQEATDAFLRRFKVAIAAALAKQKAADIADFRRRMYGNR